LNGLRDGELAGLTWADVDLGERPTVRVCKSFAREGEMGRTKNKRNRTAPLHSATARLLRAWRGRGWIELIGRKSKPADPIFPALDVDGKAVHHRPKSADHLRRDLRAAGLPDTYEKHDIVFHSLRASFASYLHAAGVPEDARKRLMGHAATDVTSAHYTAKDVEALRPHVESIRLDLAAGEVVYLRAVGGQRLAVPAELPAVRGKTAGNGLSEPPNSSSKNRDLGHLSSVVEQRFRKP
jgi:integrase